ncbi:MAG: cytochrome c3 family protein [Acidobacteriota bacterium]
MKLPLGTLAAILLLCLPGPGAARAQEVEDGCTSCHLELGDEFAETVQNFEGGIHASRGLSCHDCHGGDPNTMDMDAAMSPEAGFEEVPSNGREQVLLCASCHSDAGYMHGFDPGLRIDQFAEYKSSIHGKRLFGEGDSNVATCVSCHGVHGIRAVRDPRSTVYPARIAETCASCHENAALMGPYNLPTDQYDDYRKSVHADLLYKDGDISAPTCNDCHGNHGAAPPGGGTVANVCGQCHVFFKEYFLESPHREPFDPIGQCTHCHGNHEVQRPTDAWIGAGPEAVCVRCHDKADSGYAAAVAMHDSIVKLREAVAGASRLLDRAEKAGMEISGPRYELRDANESLVKARSLIHTLDPSRVGEMTGKGLEVAAEVEQKGLEALAEMVYRRRGLLLSLVLILGLMGSVIWKIRDLSRRRAEG